MGTVLASLANFFNPQAIFIRGEPDGLKSPLDYPAGDASTRDGTVNTAAAD
jgi:hypothetical protein